MAERLAFLISSLGITQTDFARRVDFTQAYISMILNGTKTHPSARFLDAVCREFNVNPAWLRAGHGPVFAAPGGDAAGPDAVGPDAEILAKYHLLPPADQAMVDEIIDAFLVRSMAKRPPAR